ncbi:MAG: DinB family protein [Candidatus Zixiibacteriota bacterium]|nr:MAG: DinB family protein [candidate division Zixibacteria bacterium]
MVDRYREIIWQQFGAAIDALGAAIEACPGELWDDRSRKPEFWYVAYHALFWLDYYLTDDFERFAPPAPFKLEELDSAGILPERPYTKDELRAYLKYGREKCRTAVGTMTEEKAQRAIKFGRVDLSFAELLLYNMRHVQHHAAQLNLILRQIVDSAPGWVFRAGHGSL